MISASRPLILVALVSAAVAPAQSLPQPVPPSPVSLPAPLPPPPLSAGSTIATRPAKGVRYDVRNDYTLAFVDADIRRVIDAVLGQMLGADYSIDPKVQGNITLRTAKPVMREALLPLLEEAVGAVDAVIVLRGTAYRVVPRAVARANAPLAASGVSNVSSPGFATEVVTLQSASAREIARLLEQFLGKDVVAGTDLARNQVIITGTADERQSARAMIVRFDVDALAGMNFELFKLDTVDPETLLAELERIFKPPFDIIGSRVRIVPLPRLRSVLAIAVDRSDIIRIETWIRRLDVGSGGKPKLYSYSVQNGRARDLAASLQLVLGVGGVSSVPAATGTSSTTGGFGSSTSGGGFGSASSGAKFGSGLGSSSGATAGAGSLPASQAPADQSPPAISGGSSSGDGPRIVPNDDTNALLIYATGEQYELIREVLEKLDRAVPQVLIEATLAEVTLGNDLSYGVDWSALSGATSFNLRNNASAVPATVFPGFAFGYAGATAQAVLNTLQSKTSVRVLSAPKLIVLNNQTATLQVGDQVPIVTQQGQSVAAAGAPIVNSIELRDTGVILKVTPRVNDSGAITLDIAQEVSDVAQTTTSGINSPTIQQRRLSTTVSTRSGQMVALGGLIRDRTTRVRSGIPFLSQIPVIGAAFGRHTDVGSRTELIILITPTVLRSLEDTHAAVEELINGLDTTRPLVDRALAKQVGGKLPVIPAPPPR